MTVTKDKIGSEMHIIEKSDAEKFLKINSATRSMNVSEAKLGSQRHEDEPSSEKTKKKTSLKSSEVRSILGKKKTKLRASTATKNFMFFFYRTPTQPVESMFDFIKIDSGSKVHPFRYPPILMELLSQY
jgi:hypothetical protein